LIPILICGLALLRQTPDVKVWVGLYHAPASTAPALAQWLGEGYGVTDLNDRQVLSPDFPKGTGDLGESDPTKRRVAVLFPDPLSKPLVDGYVPKILRQVKALQKLPEPKSIFVVVPPGRDEYSKTYLQPLTRQAAKEAGVKAIEVTGATLAEAIGEAVQDPRIEKKDWKLVKADSEQIDEGPAANAIDGNPDTYWHTMYDPTEPKPPHQIEVDLGKTETIDGFRYLPRQDGGINGRVKGYEFYVSQDGQTWTKVATGVFPNTNQATRVKFDGGATTAKFFRFIATSEQAGGPWTTAAEIDVLRSKP